MITSNEKIGQLIARIRQERGLTQSEFAKRMGTSQSAINRIEHGKQNLSLETLGRISDVLNKQLISLGSGAVNLRIEGGQELKGEITLKTSKNAAVGLLEGEIPGLSLPTGVNHTKEPRQVPKNQADGRRRALVRRKIECHEMSSVDDNAG